MIFWNLKYCYKNNNLTNFALEKCLNFINFLLKQILKIYKNIFWKYSALIKDFNFPIQIIKFWLLYWEYEFSIFPIDNYCISRSEIVKTFLDKTLCISQLASLLPFCSCKKVENLFHKKLYDHYWNLFERNLGI